MKNVEWKISDHPVNYPEAIAFMENRVANIQEGKNPELIWLLEHPPLITAGTSAKSDDLFDKKRFPVFETGRGGQYTYHGPGQRVIYAMLDLRVRGADVRKFIRDLEEWIILALSQFNINAERRTDRIGIWVRGSGNSENKIASIGIRIRKWISFHGIAINVDPDLDHFSVIRPCGIEHEEYGVTSLVELGLPVTLEDLDMALIKCFEDVFV